MRGLSIVIGVAGASLLATSASCASHAFSLPPNVDARKYVVDPAARLGSRELRFRGDACDGVDLTPDRATLNEASFVRFLEARGFAVDVQRQPVDEAGRELHFVFVRVPGLARAVPLRVAVLPSADAAGRSLYEAVLERGTGAWGVHRANVAVLGPAGSTADDLALAGLTKAACWGTFTVAGADDAFVVPGAYGEP